MKATLVRSRTRTLLAVGALTLASLPLIATGASATPPVIPTAPGAWGTITMPLDFSPNVYVLNWYGVDGLGNVYYVPGGSLPGSRPNLQRAHAASRTSNMIGQGIEEYTPSTGQSTFIDTSRDFTQMSGLAVEPSGNVDIVVGDYNLNQFEVMRVAPSGAETILNSTIPNLGNPGGIAVDSAGDVFVSTYDYGSNNSTIYEIPAVGGGYSTVGVVTGDEIQGLAVAPNGTVYASTGIYGSGRLYAVTPSATSTVAVDALGAFGAAVDGAGNVFAAAAIPFLVEQLAVNGPAQYLPPSPSLALSGHTTPEMLAYGAGTIYMWDAGILLVSGPRTAHVYQRNVLYTWGASSGARPFLTSVGAVSAHVENRYTQSITATWTGGGPTYECTLMTGFNAPTKFTVITTSHSCTFYNLALGTSFGISVVSISGGVASAPQVGFAPAPKVTITCVLGKRHLHRTGIAPHCPPGWRQV